MDYIAVPGVNKAVVVDSVGSSISQGNAFLRNFNLLLNSDKTTFLELS